MHRYTAGRPLNMSVAEQCVNVVNLLEPKRPSRFVQQSPSLLKVRFLVGRESLRVLSECRVSAVSVIKTLAPRFLLWRILQRLAIG